MVNCPIKQCGRSFENDQTMLQHVRRRHPHQYGTVRQGITKSLIERQHSQQQQLSKLPRLAKILSNQARNIEKLAEVSVRPSSKTRKLQSANLSSIIQQSRMVTSGFSNNKKSIGDRRPSLAKKNSSDLKIDRLLPIQKQTPKALDSSIEAQQTSSQFYTTLPNFKLKKQERKISSSKGKSKQKQQRNDASDKNNLRSTMTALSNARNEQMNNKTKKGLVRPTKKVEKKIPDKNTKKGTEVEEAKQVDFGQRIVTIKSWDEKFFNCPSTGKIQILYLNNCGLQTINLNSLQSLVEFSATHNSIKDMEFLNFSKNHNIKVVHVDHNQISSVYTPPKIKVFTASFNLIEAENIYEVCAALKRSPDIEEIDLSFNQVRKGSNYKLKVLGAAPKLRKIDGLTVTKIDVEMVQELAILQSKQRGLIPLQQSWQERPGSAVSEFQMDPTGQVPFEKSMIELQKQQKQYEKMIQETEQQLKIITHENQIISSELQQLNKKKKEMPTAWESESLLKKLQKECQFLQLLNILQYADEEELKTMVVKKKHQLGLPVE